MLKSILTKGLTKEEVKLVEEQIDSYIVEHLKRLLIERLDTKERISIKETEYDNSNWAYKQADTVGYKRGLTDIISLLTKTTKENK